MKKHLRILPDIGGVYCFVLFSVLVTIGAKHALSAGDTFWHIKAGEVMLDRHSLLATDIFSHTAYGKPWITHEWLSEIIMAGIHMFAGLDGVALFFLLIACLTYWLLFRLLNHFSGEGLTTLCVSVAVLLTMPHLLARPHIFTWLFGVANLYILMIRRDKLFLLPVLTVVWANLHGGFMIGILLQVFFIAGYLFDNHPDSLININEWLNLLSQSRKPLIVLSISILAAGILNPFGFELFIFPFQVTKELFMNHIGEWIAPNLSNEWYFRYYILGLIFILTFNFHRINWTSRLLLIFFINSALSHFRHISLAGLFLAPLLAELLAPLGKRLGKLFHRETTSTRQLSLSPLTGPLATLCVASAILIFCYSSYGRDHKSSPVFFPLPEVFPSQAVRYIKNNPPEGKMFNDYFLGGYLIYTLAPFQKVFIDGRADMYGEKIFGDYQKIVQLDEKVDELLAGYGIGWIIFPVKRPLVLYLEATSRWTEIYRDDQVVIMERKQPLPVH